MKPGTFSNLSEFVDEIFTTLICPLGESCFLMDSTVPFTGLCTGEDMLLSSFQIICPIVTVSPDRTSGFIPESIFPVGTKRFLGNSITDSFGDGCPLNCLNLYPPDIFPFNTFICHQSLKF